MILSNKNGKVYMSNSNLIFINNNDEKIMLEGIDEFSLLINNKKISSSSCKDVKHEYSDRKVTISYSYDDFQVYVNYLSKTNTFIKNVEIKSNKDFFLKQIVLESRKSNVDLTLGFEGMPCFAKNLAWFGIEFPACNNKHKDNVCNFLETPFFNGKYFKSLDVVYYLNNENDIEQEFRSYVKSFALNKKNNPYRVFCNWGLYDNLTPNDPIIDDKLANKNIDDLTYFLNKSNTHIDYYIMDAFWHKEGMKYLYYDEKVFPNGINNIVNRVENLDMKFGLWFDINFIHNKPTDFNQYSTQLGNNSYCFACDEVANSMTEAIIKHIKEDHLKMIKLDFAYFECNNPNHNHSIENVESKEKSIKNFIKMVDKIHQIDDEIIILCYNGWTINLECLACVKELKEKVVSPYWLKYVNYIYCGDPRPSEIPTRNFATSLVYYSDSMLRNFYESYIPLYAIDDHGTMVGTTGTIYRVKKENFRQSILHNVLRGTNKINPYGDISLLDDEDLKYYHFVDDIFKNIIKNNMECEFVLGDVRKDEVYGYLMHSEYKGYILIVNPNYQSFNVNVDLKELNNKNLKLKLLIKNGKIINQESYTFNNFIVNLEQEDYLLYEYEIDNKISKNSILNESKPLIEKEKYSTKILNGIDNIVIDTNNYSSLIICFNSLNNNPIRTINGYPDKLEIFDENKKKINDNFPCEAIWSGVSWLYLNIKNCCKVNLIYNGKPIKISYRLEK